MFGWTLNPPLSCDTESTVLKYSLMGEINIVAVFITKLINAKIMILCYCATLAWQT